LDNATSISIKSNYKLVDVEAGAEVSNVREGKFTIKAYITRFST
jgi:hypothetical protein